MSSTVVRGKEPLPSLVNHFAGHRGAITSIVYHPVTQHVFTAGSEGFIMKWDIKNTKNRTIRFADDKDLSPVNDISISKSGDLLLSAHKDSTARIWVPTVTGRVLQIKAHTGQVFSSCFNPNDQSYFATAGADKTVKIWSVNCTKTKASDLKFKSYDFESSYKDHTNWVRSVRYHKDGFLLCSAADDKTIRLHDTRIPNLVETMTCPMGSPTHADFNPCSEVFIGASLDNSGFLMFDTRKLDVIQAYTRLSADNSSNNSFAFHPTGDFAVCGFQDASIKILDLIEGRPIFTVYGAKKPLMAVNFSPSGSFFATGGEDRQLLIWEATLLPYTNDETENVTDLNKNDDLTSNPSASMSQSSTSPSESEAVETDN